MSMPLNLFPFNAVLGWGTAGSSTDPCQGSRVVAESQEFSGLLENSELCMRVHCFDALPMCQIPVSLASGNMLLVSVTSELECSNVDSLFDLWGSIHGEHSLPCHLP
jgi:hypothetical protein